MSQPQNYKRSALTENFTGDIDFDLSTRQLTARLALHLLDGFADGMCSIEREPWCIAVTLCNVDRLPTDGYRFRSINFAELDSEQWMAIFRTWIGVWVKSIGLRLPAKYTLEIHAECFRNCVLAQPWRWFWTKSQSREERVNSFDIKSTIWRFMNSRVSISI